MKTGLISLFKIVLFLIQTSLFAQVYNFEGIITTDTIWQADTMKITGDVFVDSAATLNVLPEIYIEFQGHYKIEIKGIIKALGNEADSIFFAINDTTFHSDTSTVKGGWHGIRFLSRSPCDTSIFRYCNFKYGKSIIVGSYWQYEIEDNKGGAIYANNYPAIKISNCSFLNNYALNSGGAVYFYDNNYVNVENCNFKNNKTIYKGGGISLVNCDNVFIENNEFIKNIAFHVYAGFAHGLGAAIMSDNPGFSNTRIINNKCYNNKTLAGTIYESNLYHTITGNLLCNNFGIALFNGHSASYGKYMNNNIINNYYTFLSGMQCSSSNLLINSNIFWNNETYTQDTMQILFVLNSNPTVIYNCIQYGQSGEGNIDQNPLFVNPSPGAGLDYHGWLYDWSILDSSPCINAGTPDTTGLFIPEYDIAGNPRICGFRIDMGAYENQQFVFIQSSIVSCKQNNIYPNPGRNKLTIKTTTKNSHFELFDITGKILLKKFIPDYSTEVNVSNLPKGMYFYRIYDNKNIIKTGKWVKQ